MHRPVRHACGLAALALAAGLAATLPATENPPAVATEATDDAPIPLLPTPIVSLTRTGQFQVMTLDADASRAGLAMAAEVWQTLATPLSLPAGGFATPVEVHLVLPEKWAGPGVFRVTPEAGGRVSLAFRWTAEPAGSETLRRALVQALLVQRAFALHGATVQKPQ